MRINVLSHTKLALSGTPNIAEEDREKKLAITAKWILADLTGGFPEYVTPSGEEAFVVELETEKASADGVDINQQYMRILGLYTAAYWSDGFLGLTQSFNLEL